MAIYKPNNFYPYMQSVNMASTDGVIFSCQANTDGNSMIRAARLKIMDKDKNVVLYENIKNLDRPVGNGGIIEFKVEPYIIYNNNNGEFKTSFISLSYNSDYGSRRTYCPYCLYNSQIYLMDYFSLYKLKNNNQEQKKISINDYVVVQTDDVDEFNSSIYSIKTTNDIIENTDNLFITLKNNNDYIWNIDLYEHEIHTLDYDGTFLTDSFITGSNDYYLWFNIDNQDRVSLSEYYDTSLKNYFVEMECTYDNSNFFEEEIKKNNFPYGEIININTSTKPKKILSDSPFVGNFYLLRGNDVDVPLKRVTYRKNQSYVTVPYTTLLFGDFYEIDEETKHRKLKKNFLNTSYLKLNNTSKENHPSFCYDDRSLDSYGKVYDQPLFSMSFSNTNSMFTYYSNPNQWYYVENVFVNVDNINEKLYLNVDNAYISNEKCYRIPISTKTSNPTIIPHSLSSCFACKNAETHIVATSVDLNKMSEFNTIDQEYIESIRGQIKTKSALNSEDKTKTIGCFEDELIYEISGILYRMRVLNPVPLNFNNNIYNFNNTIDVDYYYYSDDENYPRNYLWTCNGGYVSLNWNNENSGNDYVCFVTKETYFNAIEDIFFIYPNFHYLSNYSFNDTTRDDGKYTYIWKQYKQWDIAMETKSAEDGIKLKLNKFYDASLIQNIDRASTVINKYKDEDNNFSFIKPSSNNIVNCFESFDTNSIIHKLEIKNRNNIELKTVIKNKTETTIRDSYFGHLGADFTNQTTQKLGSVIFDISQSDLVVDNIVLSDSYKNIDLFSDIIDYLYIDIYELEDEPKEYWISSNTYSISTITDDITTTINYNTEDGVAFVIGQWDDSKKIDGENTDYSLFSDKLMGYYYTTDGIMKEISLQKIDFNLTDEIKSCYIGYYITDDCPVGTKIYYPFNDIIFYKNLKIKNIFENGIILLDDITLENVIRSQVKKIRYNLKYIRREPVSFKDEIHNYYNLLKLETENPFDFHLNNNSLINIYPTSEITTKNSFFAIIDNFEDVENLYIRFPNYEGYDYANNLITSVNYFDLKKYRDSIYTKTTDNKLYEKYGDLSDYEFPEEVFKKQDDKDYYKLFKITSYDIETNEIIFAGGLERKLSKTDIYEIWEAKVIEGGSNYDITEIVRVFTRKNPYHDSVEILKVNDVEPLITNGLKVMNTCSDFFFIPPNINLINTEYNYPYVKRNNKKIYLEKYIKPFSFENKINNAIPLDNTQWLIPQQNNFLIGDSIELYQDVVSSETNYFYGREVDRLVLYLLNIEDYNNANEDNLSKIMIDGYLFERKKVEDYYIISTMDFFLAGMYYSDEKIKRYCIKIYNSNMELVHNSNDVFGSQILYHVRGLNNDEMYYMSIECEDQLGNIIIYEQKFLVQYTDIISNTINLKIENDCEKSRTIITFINQNNENCLIDDFINAGILEDSIIDIYRRDYNGNIEWIFNIDLQNDKTFYGYENNDYKYAFYDYNVRNDEKYEYFAVLKFIQISDTVNRYLFAKGEIITSFDSWTLVDVIEDKDGLYSAIGDVWSFRYNLESEDLVQNTSITTWDTLGRYGQVGKGEKNYISSGLRCLLGDISYYNTYNNDNQIIKKYGYNEKYENIEKKVTVNNITKYKKWQKFCNSFSKKLLKDLKGNKWIVQIVENPTVSNADNSKEQLYTISFNWHEVDDANLISICNRVENIASDNDFKEKSERYMNYGDANVVPSDSSLFNFTIDDETMTASVSLAPNSTETIVYGLNRTITNNKLSNIVIPYKYEKDGKEYLVTSIDTEGFANSFEIETIRIPNCVYFIGEAAFFCCVNLKDIIINSNDNYMSSGGVLFNKNQTELIQYPLAKSNKNYTIPETVNKIHTKAFANSNNLELIITPQKMNEIGNYAFADCQNVKNIIISDGVEIINEGLFDNCINLDTIIIPNSVTEIKENAFNSCDVLTSIYYLGTEENYNEITGCNILSRDKIYADGYQLLNLDNSTIKIEDIEDELKITILSVNDDISGDVIVPMYITDIIKDTFYNCNQVEKIILPNKLNSMEDDVFADCIKLTSIFIDYNNVNYSSEHGVLFNKNKTQLIRYPQNNQIVDYYIPDTVNDISEYAFYKCCHLTNLQISENNENYTTDNYGVLYNKNKTELIQYPSANERILYSTAQSTEVIKPYSFYNANRITKLIFERNIKLIDNNAFVDYYNRINLYYYGDEDQFNNIDIDLSNDIFKKRGKSCLSNWQVSGDFSNENLSWEMYETTLKISGNNNMPDFTLTENAPWKYHSVEDLIDNIIFDIPDRTSFYIGAYTFYDLVNLKNIELPTIPLVIGNHAFENCKSLENINFSELVNDIGEYAFAGCSKLKQIDLSKGLSSKRISNNLFMSCYSLTGVNLPNDIISIGDNAFLQCQNLEYLEIPETVIYIGSQAFSNCKITNITIPKNVNNIEKRAFMECFSLMEINVDSNNNIYSSMDGVLFSKDKSTLICYPIGKSQVYGEDGSLCGIYDIPNTVTRIEDYAFEFSKLIQVNIPEITINESVGTNLTQIGKESFVYSNIQTINLVPGIFYVEDMAFAFCYNLTTINETNEVPDSVNYLGNDVFYGCENLIYTVPENVSTLKNQTYYYNEKAEIFIPNSIKKIDALAFYNCPNLKIIHIPSSVEDIALDMVWSCDNFVNFDVDVDNSYYSSRDGLLCNRDGTVLISVPFGITDLTIPSCITTITSDSFSSLIGLNSLYIPDTVEIIEYRSLYYIYGRLKSLRLPFIGQIRGDIGSLNQMIFGGDTVEASEEYNLEELIISDTVETISFNALSMNYNANDNRLYGCSNLKKLTVPFAGGNENSNKYLAYIFGSDGTLDERKNYIPETLTELTITNTQRMGNSCLYGFNNLEKLTIPFVGTGYYNSNNAAYIFGLIFGASGYGDQGSRVPISLKEVIITNQNNRIDYNAFQNCRNIEKIVIFSGINIINPAAFQYCTSLREIYIPRTVKIIEDSFYNCMNITDIYYEGTKEEWNNIQIKSQSTTSFTNATKHYNSNYKNEY